MSKVSDKVTAVSTRFRFLEGVVVSDKMEKSIVVNISRRKKHALGKYINSSRKIHAHDCDNLAEIGDTVSIREGRPYSKQKRWLLDKIIKKGDGKS